MKFYKPIIPIALLMSLMLLAGCMAQTADEPIASVGTTDRVSVGTPAPGTTRNIPIATTPSIGSTTSGTAPETTVVPPVKTSDEPARTTERTAPTNAGSTEPVATPSAPPVTEEPTVTVPVGTATEPTVTTPTPVTTTSKPETTTVKPVTTTTVPVTTTKPETTTTVPATTTTAPVTTSPPAHVHSYGAWTTVKAATCTESGTQQRVCSCGATESRTVPATGHSFGEWVTTLEPTLMGEGSQTRTCSRCQATETQAIEALRYKRATPDDSRLIADMVIYYINQFRVEEGSIPATKLERYTLVAEYRSQQIVTNFAHDNEDNLEANTKYQYGEHVVTEDSRLDLETGEVIYTGEIIDYYYAPGAGEAINAAYGFGNLSTIDAVAWRTVNSIHNSQGHWAYVGSSAFPYIAVGMAYAEASEYNGAIYSGNWFCCIKVIDTTKYE